MGKIPHEWGTTNFRGAESVSSGRRWDVAFHDQDLVAAGEDVADRGPAVAEVEAAVEPLGLEAEAGEVAPHRRGSRSKGGERKVQGGTEGLFLGGVFAVLWHAPPAVARYLGGRVAGWVSRVVTGNALKWGAGFPHCGPP